ncbi:hypothetical protein ACHAQH_006685 [Verticillium albo-atrum]
MAKGLSLPVILTGMVISAAGGLAVSIPQSIERSKILRQVRDVHDEYDYIIVGGGTAGLTVADRLTESGEHTVLVIELGLLANDSSVNNVAGGAQAFFNSSLTFNFPSEPQVNLGGRTTNVFGGVLLGGSSGVNGFQVHRPQKADINRWGSYFSKCSDWNWESLLPYFKKAWQLHPPTKEMVEEFDIKYDESYWGTEGGIHAMFPSFSWPFLKNEMDAYREIEGVDFPIDSGAGNPGAFWYPHSANPQQVTRSFALSEHWTGKVTVRDNYETVLGQRVLRVLFQDKVAAGVEYVAAGATDSAGSHVVRARKEVIVAAGTIHTPQILEASGVGGRALLEKAGIDVVVDLPGVGANFQDHPLGGGASFTFTDWNFHPDSSDLQTNETFRAEVEAEFAESHTGDGLPLDLLESVPLTQSGPLTIASGNAASFLPFSVIAPSAFEAIASAYEAQDPAAYLPANSDPTLIAGYAAQKTRFAAALRSTDAAFYNLFLRGTNTEGSSIVFLHPLSRGTVHIDTADPFFAQPRVDYRALSNPTDLDIQVEFIKFSRRYFLETSLAQYGPVEVSPGANVTSDEALREALRELISPTCFHPVGTAAMMPRELGGVVNEELLVYGVKRLSVIDASVQPDLPGAYTQQPVFAIAEKAADLIKARA